MCACVRVVVIVEEEKAELNEVARLFFDFGVPVLDRAFEGGRPLDVKWSRERCSKDWLSWKQNACAGTKKDREGMSKDERERVVRSRVGRKRKGRDRGNWAGLRERDSQPSSSNRPLCRDWVRMTPLRHAG